MDILLDTCTFLWFITNSSELSSAARHLIISPDNTVYLSAASAWEISIKYTIGRLSLPRAPRSYIPEQREKHGILPLPVNEESGLHVSALVLIHRDPFDRMLAAQSIIHGMVILTPDDRIRAYPVRTIW